MHMLDLVSDIAMASSSSQMEISEPFRTEDLSKTDFFDFVTGSAPDMAITSSTGGGGNVAVGGGSASVGNSRPLAGAIPPVTDRPPGGRSSGGNEGVPAMDGTGPSRGTPSGPAIPDGNDQPLQGFDQFWGSDKDSNRLDPAMFEDLNRYCWIQQNNNNNNNNTATSNNNNNNNSSNNNGALNNQVADTDGQIYTLTVLNGAPEPWVLRKDPTVSEPAAPASNLDLDTILGGFPGYVKTECFSYDDSGFGTDHHAKDDQHQQQQQQQQQQQHQQQHLLVQQQQQQQQQQQHAHHTQTQSQLQQVQAQQQQMPVTSSSIVLSSNLLDPNSVLAYQNNNNNNNNDWQMSDHNVIQQDTAESLLRSALQGKGYTKGTGLQLPNGTVTVLPAPGHMKDEELRRVLYSAGDPSDSLAAYADSTLANSIYDEPVLHSPVSGNPPNSSQQQQQQQVQQLQHQHQQLATGDLVGGEAGTGPGSVVAVDDMFLTLDAAFPDDYEKLKRIATEVQQFCTDNNNYTEIIVEAPAIGNGPPPAPPGTTNNNHLHSNSPATVLLGNHLPQQQQQHHQLNQHQGASPGMLLSPTDAGSLNRQPVSTTTSSDVVTTTSTTKAKTPRVKKNYKRSLSSSTSNSGSPNPAGCNNGLGGPNLACLNTTAAANNNNNTSMSNLNAVAGPPGGAMLSPNSVTGSSSTTTTTSSSSSTTSPTQCGNGQRKERSLHYCSICSKGFKDKYSVNVHIRTHTGEKPFACSLCGKSFRQKAHLAKHYQTHLAQKNPASGAVAKQSKQSRMSAPPPLPDPSGQLPAPPPPPPPSAQAGPAISLAVSNIPPGPPPGVTMGQHAVQPQSPPMLLNNNSNNNNATIVASR